ncbi:MULTISPECIES: hypothetical protein [unclassified Rhizobacter]|uniref:hypothetical protein n=1 Tax=unclassified Rhizobacter TaxID=2640088 RepID=UPI0006F83B74|nr:MULTISPECIES: hypothetical protein [unclassified Rhizobacter]KQU76799.1 hypothetical protein ASC88_02400 [Rhizobacter sp. Root29]KQV97319.1 hypothetical protein ASC98_11930 [Rhizobacter sp. Root1238]KRB09991.1 hypothetical protein ASE08_10565 [Rhizobacter sp. Root16D2]
MKVFLGLKTRPELLSKLQQTVGRKPSAAEILEQRISFVFGSLKPDSGITREQVRQILLEHDGSVSKS